MTTNALADLLELKRNSTIGNGSKKIYFERNKKLIFELLANGATYSEVIAAAEKDGAKMSLRYFTQLIKTAKNDYEPPKGAVKSSIVSPESALKITKSPTPTRAEMAKKREENAAFIKKVMGRNPLTERDKKLRDRGEE